VSNLFGMWVEHFDAIDVAGFAAAVDRAGGLRVDLPEPFAVGNQTLGPGSVVMSGAQVRAFLSTSALGPASVHFDITLSAILADPPSFADSDLSDSDGARGLDQALSGATSPQVLTFPSQFVSGSVTIPDYGAIDQLIASRFDVKTAPVPVEILNGTGGPEAVELVASRIVPEGFRITLTDESRGFAKQPTRVIANSKQELPLAERIRAALGFGRLAVSRVPSGLGDVTIVLGRNLRV